MPAAVFPSAAAGPDRPESLDDHQVSSVVAPSKQPMNQRHASNTFYRSCEISFMEPVGSMSISPANRDVVLAARKGLFIIDLEDPFAPPRFLAHMTTWEAVDIQWSPHPARSNWVASTSNQKLLIWNLDRPSDFRTAPQITRFPLRSSVSSISNPAVPITSHSAPHRAQTYHSVHNSLGAHSGASASGIFGAKSPHSAQIPGSFFGSHYHSAAPRSSAIEHVLHAHNRAITDINWSPFHPEMVASSSIDTWTWVWDLRMSGTSDSGGRCKPAQGYSAWNAAVTQVKFNRASEHRLASTCDNKVLIWDDRKGSLPLATIEAHESKIYGIDWSRDTSLGLNKLVTCSLDTTVKFWDLGSETSQAAIGAQELITDAETTIKTNTPVWRARHLPFGNGVMTLPQRGDTTLSMWGKDKPEEPQATFVGHTDIVKEYLFRTKGGQDRAVDDRQFQLITWSKDQTLRLWPVTDEQTRKVGHKPDAPIRVLMTRANAVDVSYRDPPMLLPSELNDDVALKSTGSASNITASSILPPERATRSLLSGKGSGSVLGPTSPYGSSASGFQNVLREGKSSPIAPFSTSLGTTGVIREGRSPNHGSLQLGPSIDALDRSPINAWSRYDNGRNNSEHALARSLPKQTDKAMNSRFTSSYHSGNSSSFKVPNTRIGGSMAGSHASAKTRPQQQQHRSSGRPIAIQEEQSAPSVLSNTTTSASKGKSKQKTKAKVTASRKRTDGATVGAAMRLDRGRMAGPAVDPLEWIANVRMEKETNYDTDNGSVRAGHSNPGRGLSSVQQLVAGAQKEGTATEEDSDAEHGLTSQKLGDEIVSIKRQLPRVMFEKVDVAKRFCVLTLYGPWADHEPAFLRITFKFPKTYPRQAPKFDLEKSASISLKTRAYLLKGLTRLSSRASLAGRPCIELCARLLIGEPIRSLDGQDGDHTDEDAERSTSRADGSFDSTTESEDDMPAFQSLHGSTSLKVKVKPKLTPRRMGATFGPNNELVVFGGQPPGLDSRSSSQQRTRSASRSRRPNDGRKSDRARSRSAARGSALAELHSIKSEPPQSNTHEAEDGSRFLRSYTALSSAMTSLAKFSKSASEGLGGQTADYGVRDSDVVQLMSTDFFARRLLQKSDFFDDFGDQSEAKGSGTRHRVQTTFYSGSGASTPGARRANARNRSPDERANTLHHADLRGALPAPAAVLALNRLKEHRRRQVPSTVQIYQFVDAAAK